MIDEALVVARTHERSKLSIDEQRFGLCTQSWPLAGDRCILVINVRISHGVAVPSSVERRACPRQDPVEELGGGVASNIRIQLPTSSRRQRWTIGDCGAAWSDAAFGTGCSRPAVSTAAPENKLVEGVNMNWLNVVPVGAAANVNTGWAFPPEYEVEM